MWRDRRKRIDHCLSRMVFDIDKIGGVLGTIAIAGHHDRHRFADIAYPVDCDWPAFDCRLDTHHEARCTRLDICASQNRNDTSRLPRRRSIDPDNVGMGMGLT